MKGEHRVLPIHSLPLLPEAAAPAILDLQHLEVARFF